MTSSSDKLTVVIKVGTSSLIREDFKSLNLTNLSRICEVVRSLKDKGHNVCIVTSGAVGIGCQVMSIEDKPKDIHKKQALAAIGQGHLMTYYSDFFKTLSLATAQVLLTAENLASESQYQNAQRTFSELFAYNVVPIVNENDTVAVQELRFGDNDTLSAQVAALVCADWLVLLTDVDCLYTANPNTNPDAAPIREVRDLSKLEVDTSVSGTQWGTGGMATKLTAARIACAAGCHMAICHANTPDNIERLVVGDKCGTIFYPIATRLKERKRWILSVPPKGVLHVDAGCERAILNKKNLYAAGITAVSGTFGVMDAVTIVSVSGIEIARGLVNFDSKEIAHIRGKASTDYRAQLDYVAPEEVIFRAHIALLSRNPSSPKCT